MILEEALITLIVIKKREFITENDFVEKKYIINK